MVLVFLSNAFMLLLVSRVFEVFVVMLAVVEVALLVTTGSVASVVIIACRLLESWVVLITSFATTEVKTNPTEKHLSGKYVISITVKPS